MTPRLLRPFLALLLGLALAPPGFAQVKQPGYPESLLGSLRYRLVGPFRGGRSAAVTGVPGKPLLFYFGATGGGVWRTGDGGATWEAQATGVAGKPQEQSLRPDVKQQTLVSLPDTVPPAAQREGGVDRPVEPTSGRIAEGLLLVHGGGTSRGHPR